MRGPSVEQYCRFGVSMEGIESFINIMKMQTTKEITEHHTTSDVCHFWAKPMTCPAGWEYKPTLVNAEDGFYTSLYREKATGREQCEPPDGTKSLCELCSQNAKTARFVGKPNIFVSHAWQYKFLELVAALRAFVDEEAQIATLTQC